ncbi:hypothetical protein DXG01_016380, partial [Tephrocybe rancida]
MLSHLGIQAPKDLSTNPPEVLEVEMRKAPAPDSAIASPTATTSSGHLSSSRNLFGLFKTYSGALVPLHDPDQNLLLEELHE